MANFNTKISTASGVVGLVTGAAMLAPMLVKGGAWVMGKVKGKKAAAEKVGDPNLSNRPEIPGSS